MIQNPFLESINRLPFSILMYKLFLLKYKYWFLLLLSLSNQLVKCIKLEIFGSSEYAPTLAVKTLSVNDV